MLVSTWYDCLSLLFPPLSRALQILQVLRLKHASDTLIGDEALKGVSGGERRRVSIGVEWVKLPAFMMLDGTLLSPSFSKYSSSFPHL
jgi:ABC-type multidrug transport system ATPase subunit